MRIYNRGYLPIFQSKKIVMQKVEQEELDVEQSDDFLETESISSSDSNNDKHNLYSEFNPISSVHMNRYAIEKMLPKNHAKVKPIHSQQDFP